MNIIFHSKRLKKSGHVVFCRRRAVINAVLTFVVIPVVVLVAGYQIGVSHATKSPYEVSLTWREELEDQKQRISDAQKSAEENVNALAMRLGQMQAQMIRLDALGERLTKMANLDRGEFDFAQPPGQGGPVSEVSQKGLEVDDFLSALDKLSMKLDDRSRQLAVLESMLMSRNLQAEVIPAGRPIKRGWTSSFYGMRTDPFSGKLEHHNGVDFAGKDGSDVVAVAAGVVTWAGDRYGYGRLVEVNHGNGYITRYGHSKEILVHVGDTVKKGQRVALMGSTGRSTGPHVHFEVWRNGRPVNPEKYVQMVRR